MASREPKALEESFAPRRRPERFVWFHTTYDDHSLSSPVGAQGFTAGSSWLFACRHLPRWEFAGRSKLGLDEPGRKAGSATTRHGFATAFLISSLSTADAGGSPFRPAIPIGMASLATVLWVVWSKLRIAWATIIGVVVTGLIGANCHFVSDIIAVLYLSAAIRLGIVELMLTERTVSTGRLW